MSGVTKSVTPPSPPSLALFQLLSLFYRDLLPIFPFDERLELAHATYCSYPTVSLPFLIPLQFSLGSLDCNGRSPSAADRTVRPHPTRACRSTDRGVGSHDSWPRCPDRADFTTLSFPSLDSPSFEYLTSPHGIPSPLIPIRNRRFDRVLAVDTYRLRDRSPVLRAEQVSSLTSYANQIRPRLADCVFNGNSPLQVLPFLKQIVRISDQSFLSEAVLLSVVDDFRQTPVR